MTSIAFRGLRVSLGHAHAHVDDLRGVDTAHALAEATAPTDGPPAAPPSFAPSLIVGGFVDEEYSNLKREQLRAASELWRVRARMRALEQRVLPPASLPGADLLARGHERCWCLCSRLESLHSLPSDMGEQATTLRDLAVAASLSALRAASNRAPLPWPPGASAAEDEALWAEVGTPLLSEPCSRNDQGAKGNLEMDTPATIFSDLADWRCWLLSVRHPPSGRTVVVAAALRKPLPPQPPGVQRLAFVALGQGGAHEGGGGGAAARLEARLRSEVLMALDRWRPSVQMAKPQPRRALVEACEDLAFSSEYARRVLPLRPSVTPLVQQATDAVVLIAKAAKEPDGRELRDRVHGAVGRMVESLRRAAALRPEGASRWRHRLSSQLALELTARPELADARELMPLSKPSEKMAALRSAALTVLEGFGPAADRRQKPAELVAVEAFAEGRKKAGGSARLRTAALEVISLFGGPEGRRAKSAEVVAVEAFEEARRRGVEQDAALEQAAGAAAAAMRRWEANAASAAEVEAKAAAEAEAVEQAAAARATAPAEAANGDGLKTLLRLHAHPNCAGSVRRVLGDVLDFLLHLTPAEELLPAGHKGAAIDVRSVIDGGVADVERCLEPLQSGAGLAANADVICATHATAGTASTLTSIAETAAEEAATPTAEGAFAFSADTYGGPLSYLCNVELLGNMLREGYIERRLGSTAQYARLLTALIEGCIGRQSPPFLLRVLAEGAWACARTARVRAGARLGHDAGLEAAERKLAVLGPAAVDMLRADLTAVAEAAEEEEGRRQRK